jgi:hypothetical protein
VPWLPGGIEKHLHAKRTGMLQALEMPKPNPFTRSVPTLGAFKKRIDSSLVLETHPDLRAGATSIEPYFSSGFTAFLLGRTSSGVSNIDYEHCATPC